MQHSVRIFVVRTSTPNSAPVPEQAIVVDGATLDGVRVAARTQLEASGFRIRSLNFSGTGLIAYVEERTR